MYKILGDGIEPVDNQFKVKEHTAGFVGVGGMKFLRFRANSNAKSGDKIKVAFVNGRSWNMPRNWEENYGK